MEGRVWFGGRHLRAALEGAGEQGFLAIHQRRPTEDQILVGMHCSGAQDVVIGGFIQVLREVGLAVGRPGGRTGREKHFQEVVKGERSISTMRLGHFSEGKTSSKRIQVVVARLTTWVVAVSMRSRNRSGSTQRAKKSPVKDARHDIHGMTEGAGTRSRGMTRIAKKRSLSRMGRL